MNSTAPNANSRLPDVSWSRSILAFIILVALLMALSRQWMADDAYLGFRYAQNLAQGNGLVFNRGHRVDGGASPVWNVWTAVGLLMHIRPEIWTNFWALFFYMGTVILLLRFHDRSRIPLGLSGAALPLAALMAALHRDWNIYATAGLELSLLTFLLTTGFLLVSSIELSRIRLVAAGFVVAFAFLARFEGWMFGVIFGIVLLIRLRKVPRKFLYYFIPLISICALGVSGYFLYYGELPHLLKTSLSANAAALDQGMFYAGSYFYRYWCQLVWIPLFLITMATNRKKLLGQSHLGNVVGLCVAVVLSYLFYVVWIGGDTAFARSMIPILPFLSILTELAVLICFTSEVNRWVASTVIVLGLVFTPSLMHGPLPNHNITDDWEYARAGLAGKSEENGLILRRYFESVPLRMAFFRNQARLVYYAKPDYAVLIKSESADPYFTSGSGMDSVVNPAPPDGVQFIFDHRSPYSWNRFIPYVPVEIERIHGRILSWDPKALDILKSRGAVFPDFVMQLDHSISKIDETPIDQVKQDYSRFKRFYFDSVGDAKRESRFLARIESTIQ